jgi:hypothetical protein
MEKEGANLPNSETEDIVGLSLRPKYPEKQLRRINRLHRAKYNDVPKDPKSSIINCCNYTDRLHY